MYHKPPSRANHLQGGGSGTLGFAGGGGGGGPLLKSLKVTKRAILGIFARETLRGTGLNEPSSLDV